MRTDFQKSVDKSVRRSPVALCFSDASDLPPSLSMKSRSSSFSRKTVVFSGNSSNRSRARRDWNRYPRLCSLAENLSVFGSFMDRSNLNLIAVLHGLAGNQIGHQQAFHPSQAFLISPRHRGFPAALRLRLIDRPHATYFYFIRKSIFAFSDSHLAPYRSALGSGNPAASSPSQAKRDEHPKHPALQWQVIVGILPELALYQILQEGGET